MKKVSTIFILWLFFMFISLLHTMNAEIGQINKFQNDKLEKYSGFEDNEKSLAELRNDLNKKNTEIDKNISNKDKRIAEIREDKKELNKAFEGNISDTDKNLQDIINTTSNKYLSNKNTRAKEKTSTITNLLTQKNELLSAIDNKITEEDSRLQEIINISKSEKKEIEKNIKLREDNVKITGDEIKNTEGLNPFINLMLNLSNETGRSIITLLLTLIVAFGLDLAGCQTLILYYKKTKTENKDLLFENPKFYLFLTAIIFLVSAYATGLVFMSGRVGFDLFIGLLKTVGMELCKIIFYKEYKSNKFNLKDDIQKNIPEIEKILSKSQEGKPVLEMKKETIEPWVKEIYNKMKETSKDKQVLGVRKIAELLNISQKTVELAHAELKKLGKIIVVKKKTYLK